MIKYSETLVFKTGVGIKDVLKDTYWDCYNVHCDSMCKKTASINRRKNNFCDQNGEILSIYWAENAKEFIKVVLGRNSAKVLQQLW